MIERMLRHAARYRVEFEHAAHLPAERRWDCGNEVYAFAGFPIAGDRSFWDADHIVPVVEGGGECDLDNIRTLCVPCHKDATRRLAQRRASARRIEGSRGCDEEHAP